MSKDFNLQPLLELLQSRTDDATRQLGKLIAAEQSAKSRLDLLEQYRADYAQKFREAAANGLTQMAWRNYEAFLARIDEAIGQQRLALTDSQRRTLAGQAAWREQNKKMKAIDTLAQRHEARQRYQENRQDQKQQDDFVSGKTTRERNQNES